jgi:hypothetical protein
MKLQKNPANNREPYTKTQFIISQGEISINDVPDHPGHRRMTRRVSTGHRF